MNLGIGRKALMAWASFVMTNIWFKLLLIDQTGYITLISMIFGMYASSNVLSKLPDALKGILGRK